MLFKSFLPVKSPNSGRGSIGLAKIPLRSASQLMKGCSEAEERKRRESLVTGNERGPAFCFGVPWDKKLFDKSGQREP